jgi:hypothetical protein
VAGGWRKFGTAQISIGCCSTVGDERSHRLEVVMVRLSVAEKAVIGERSAAGVSSRQMSRELGRPANGVGLCGVAATTSASSTAALCSALAVGGARGDLLRSGREPPGPGDRRWGGPLTLDGATVSSANPDRGLTEPSPPEQPRLALAVGERVRTVTERGPRVLPFVAAPRCRRGRDRRSRARVGVRRATVPAVAVRSAS